MPPAFRFVVPHRFVHVGPIMCLNWEATLRLFFLSFNRPNGRSRKSTRPSVREGSCLSVFGFDLVQTAEINYCPRPHVMDVECPRVVYLNDHSWDSQRRSTPSAFSLRRRTHFPLQKTLEQNEVAMNQPHWPEATDPKELVGHP